MKKNPLLSFLVAMAIVSVSPFRLSHAADGPNWFRDFDEAQAAAKNSGKDLFVLFTGHGWCGACKC